MRIATTLARRSLLQRPGRTFFSALGIALGIATAVAVRTLDHNTIEGLRLRYGSEWRPALEVRPAAEIADPRATLAEIEGIEGAAAFFQNEALLRPLATNANAPRAARPYRAQLFAVELAALPQMDAHRLIAGEEPDPRAGEPQVLVGEPVARELGLVPGDRLEISRPPRSARRTCIDGEMREVGPPATDSPPTIAFEVAGVLAREELGRRAAGEVVLVDVAWGRRLYEDARIDERYWVRPAPSVDIERLQARLSGSFAYDIGRSAVVGQAADERAFRQGVFLAGLLALALGLYVIFHTLSMSLVERLREVATLHALGASRRQIASSVLLEAAALAGVGGLLGLGLGILVAFVLLRLGITTLGSGTVIRLFEVPWTFVLPITLLGAALALVGAVFPLLRARGASTVQALRGEGALERGASARGFHLFAAILLGGILPALYFTVVPVLGEPTRALVGVLMLGVALLSSIVAIPLLVPAAIRPLCRLLAPALGRISPFSGRMAARAMLSDPRRVAVSSAALTLVTAAFVGLKGMTASLSGEIETWADEAVAQKLFVEGIPRVPFDALSRKLHEVPGVLGVEPGSARTYSPFLLIGVRVAELQSYGPIAQNPALAGELAGGRGVVLSQRLARNLGYAVGDRVQVLTGAGVRELAVVAISDAYGYFPHPDERMYGVVDDAFLEHAFCLDVDTVDRAAVRMAPDADPELVALAVQEFLGGESAARFESGVRLRDRQIEDIGRDFFLFDAILGLTALLAAIGVLNGQLLAALERAKELGVLKALGASRGQIAGMVLLESGAMGLFGGALGALLGSLLCPLIVRGLEAVSGLHMPQRGPGAWVWIAFGGAVLLALVAALYPIFRMNRLDAVRAVRTG